jgi:glycosyltransferase involved in cell wall biosynthesis
MLSEDIIRCYIKEYSIMNNTVIHIGVISSYPVIKDSISEYISDLRHALVAHNPRRFHFHYYPIQPVFFSKRHQKIWNIRTARGFFRLLRTINNSNLNILHIHYGSNFLGFPQQLDLVQHINFCYFLKNIHIPVVITAHMYFEHETKHNGMVRSFFTKKIAELTHVTLALHTDQGKNELVQLAGPKTAGRIVYIPYGFPDEITNLTEKERIVIPDIKNKYNLEGKILLSSLGLIAFWKGNVEILKNITPLLKKTTNIRYIIAGSSKNSKNYFHQVKNYIRKNNLENKVVVIDKFLTLSEMKSMLHITDVYLSYHYFKKHSSSGTIMFALGMGCPVVTNDVQFVHNKELTDALVICGSDKIYSEKVEKLVADKDMRNLYRQKAKITAAQLSWNKISLQYSNLFENAINTNASLNIKSSQLPVKDIFFLKPVSIKQIVLRRLSLIKNDNGIRYFQPITFPFVKYITFKASSCINDCFFLLQRHLVSIVQTFLV